MRSLTALLLTSLCASASGLVHAGEPIEPKIERIIIDDGFNRVEELRVSGQVVKVTVQPKDAPAYEILTGDGSHDLSPGPGSTRGAIGKRVWPIIEF